MTVHIREKDGLIERMRNKAGCGVWGFPSNNKDWRNMMKKEKVLYICGNNHIPSLECSEWYKAFQNTSLKDVIMEKRKIETPYAVIDFVYSRPLFTWKYDFVLNADKKDDDAKLFAIGIGKDY